MATLTEWSNQVRQLLRGAGSADIDSTDLYSVGVLPALRQFAIDRPRLTAVDITAVGRYLRFPTDAEGWVEAFSEIRSIDSPAGQTPPVTLLDTDWNVARDPANPNLARVLLPVSAAGSTCRVTFTTTWPVPDTDATTDILGDVAFAAVTSLAASMVLSSMAAQSARSRVGALAPDYVEVTERARTLMDAANAMRATYTAFIGLGHQTGSGAAAVPNKGLRSSTTSSASKRLAGNDRYRPWWHD
jgi:hypothetical protein